MRPFLPAFAALILLCACETTKPDITESSISYESTPVASQPVDALSQTDQFVVESEELVQVETKPPVSPEEYFALEIGDRILFDTDQYTLDAKAQETLRRQAAFLLRNPHYRAIIEGHADERGTREYNLALGDKRASSTKRFLTWLGVPDTRVVTISYGKERPVALGSDQQSWAQNRRAVTILKQLIVSE